MKTFPSPIRLLLICFMGIFFFACEENIDAPKQTYSPQMSSGSTCDHLDVTDLDLSGGFRGQYRKLPASADADFSITGHSPLYPFNPNIPADEDCDGYCSIRILFEPTTPGGIPAGTSLDIAALNLEYTSGGTTNSTNVVGYEWNYPELFVYDIYANTIMDYEVTFENGGGDYVAIALVDVVGGLCVIENIDETDPVYVTSKDEGNDGGN